MANPISFEICTNNDQQIHSSQQSQEASSQVETDQKTVDDENQHPNLIKAQLKRVTQGDIKGILHVKIDTEKLNEVLEGLKKSFKAKLILDVGFFIYFLSTFIYSIVRFAIKQDPLSYNIVCNVITFIGLAIGSCTLAHTLYKHYTKEHHRMIRVQPQDSVDEDFDTDTLKELAIDILKESFIYPGVICSLYGFVNEKSWRFDDAVGGLHFFMFLFSLWYDALYTKLKYIWAMQKNITSLWYESDDNRKTRAMKCCLSSLLFTSHVCLFVIMHWIMLAIIGVRIYVDNFSIEIDQGNRSETSGYQVSSYRINVGNFSTDYQGNRSETGGYEVASYTGYMIACGVYLPVASVIVFIILSRAWFSDEIDSTCEQIFYFLVDPVAYIAAIFLMVPFIAFCVGIYLPDYDSSEFEVDANARNAAEILGLAFIVTFLLFNIKAAVIFAIIIIVIVSIVLLIIKEVSKILFRILFTSEDDNDS